MLEALNFDGYESEQVILNALRSSDPQKRSYRCQDGTGSLGHRKSKSDSLDGAGPFLDFHCLEKLGELG